MSVAQRRAAGWRAEAPEAVGDPSTLLARLVARAAGAAVGLGIDCPVGVPRGWAAGRGERDFPAFLRGLGPENTLFAVAERLEEVSAARPFFPRVGRAGMRRAAHAAALGLADAGALCRACDRATHERPAGAPVFWTLGANQSGRAAISAWRDVLAPALRSDNAPALWPFDGPFRSLLAPGRVAVAETYPAEAMRQLGLTIAGSKRRQADRAAYAPGLRAAMGRLRVEPSASLADALADGFGADAAGEDRFDSLLGLLCVIGVIDGHRPDTAPDDPAILTWEGWVLGQTAYRKSALAAV